METSTLLNQREITANGTIQVRLEKRVTNGSAVVNSGWHRFSLHPGADIDAMVAAVNTNLAAMGYPAVSDADVTTIKATADLEWTSDVLSVYQASVGG